MRNVVLWPVSDVDEMKPVNEDSLARYLGADDQALVQARAGDSAIHVMGRRSSDRTRWEKVQVGDLVLVSNAGAIRRAGVVVHKCVDARVSEDRWPFAEHEDVWDHLLYIAKLEDTSIPYAELNRASGDNPKYVPFGFRVMRSEQSSAVIASLGATLPTLEVRVT